LFRSFFFSSRARSLPLFFFFGLLNLALELFFHPVFFSPDLSIPLKCTEPTIFSLPFFRGSSPPAPPVSLIFSLPTYSCVFTPTPFGMECRMALSVVSNCGYFLDGDTPSSPFFFSASSASDRVPSRFPFCFWRGVAQSCFSQHGAICITPPLPPGTIFPRSELPFPSDFFSR